MGELAVVTSPSLRGWNKWTYSMSIEYRMNHNHSELSEGKNEKLAQLHLFFHPQDTGELQSTKVSSLSFLWSACKKPEITNR